MTHLWVLVFRFSKFLEIENCFLLKYPNLFFIFINMHICDVINSADGYIVQYF